MRVNSSHCSKQLVDLKDFKSITYSTVKIENICYDILCYYKLNIKSLIFKLQDRNFLNGVRSLEKAGKLLKGNML